jgi:thioredoxin 1
MRSHANVAAGSAGVARGSRRALTGAAGAALLACAGLALAAGGCGPLKFNQINDEQKFEEQVLKADKPVLVDFFKGGCAACMVLDPLMDELAEEYKDRVVFAKFELMRFWLEITSFPIWWKYHIVLYPTVVLFVNGKEKKRWVANYLGFSYRKVLDEVAGLPVPNKKPPAATAPPSGERTGLPVRLQAPAGAAKSPAAPATPIQGGEPPGRS